MTLESGTIESNGIGIKFEGRGLSINDGTVSGASAGIAWTLPYGVEYPKIAGGLIMSGERCWEASARSWAVCGSARRSAVP